MKELRFMAAVTIYSNVKARFEKKFTALENQVFTT